jgi:RHS repeat-associated protein
LDRDAVHLLSSDGQDIKFDSVEIGGEVWIGKGTPGAMKLSRSRDRMTVTTPNRRRMHFAPRTREAKEWPLQDLADFNGNSQRFHYDEDGRLTEIIDPQERRLFLAYDSRGMLVQAAINRIGEGPLTLARMEYDSRQDLVAVYDVFGNPFRYEYQDHLIVREINRAGGSRSYVYDRQRRCVKTWLEDGLQIRDLKFDERRHATVLTDTYGYRSVYYFNEAGNCERRIDPLGCSKRTFYGTDGSLLASEDEEMGGGPVKFDAEKRVLTATDAMGSQWNYALNDINLPTSSIDPAGNQTRHEYDDRGNPVAGYTQLGHRWQYEYDERGRAVRVVDPCGRDIRIQRSADNSRIIYNDQLGIVGSFEYDRFANLVAQSDAAGHSTRFEYDLAGRVTSIDFPDTTAFRFAYDLLGNRIEAANATGAKFQYHYSRLGRLLATTHPTGQQTRLEYDDELRPTAIVSPGGERVTIVYDPLGRPRKVTLFDGQTERYEYDDQGYLAAVLDAAGLRTTYEYDPLRRITAVHYGDGNVVSFEHDKVGRLTAAENAAAALQFEFNAEGRLTLEKQPFGEVAYSYDPIGRLVEVRLDEKAVVSYEYDLRGRLSKLRDSAGSEYQITYQQHGFEVVLDSPHGVRQTTRLGPHWKPIEHKVVNARNETLLDRAYVYDRGGRIASLNDRADGTARAYHYDLADRLVAVFEGRKEVERYRYDDLGNLVATHDQGNIDYAAGHRMTDAGATQYEYDPRGNVVARRSEGKVRQLDFDAAGTLVRTSDPDGTTVEHQYDAYMRRVRKSAGPTETQFIWSGGRLLAERRPGQPDVVYLYSPTSVAPWAHQKAEESYQYVVDHLGTPRLLLDSQGAIAWRASMASFGEPSADGATIAPFLAPGQYVDNETGLAYNRTRYFDPATRRYLSPDMLRLGGGADFYAYVRNNPVNWIDPTGMQCFRQECQDAFERMDNALNTTHHPPNPVNSPHPNPPNHKGLLQRINEFAANTGWMPIERNPGDPAGGGSGYANTVMSHWEQYYQVQTHLQRALNDWWANGCLPANTNNPAAAQNAAASAEQNAFQPPPYPGPGQAGDQNLMQGIRMFKLDDASGLWLPQI